MAFKVYAETVVLWDQETERFAIIETAGRDGNRMHVVNIADMDRPCIGCGCSESDPCADHCEWLYLGEESGVCSNCAAHAERWNAGERSIVIPPDDEDRA